MTNIVRLLPKLVVNGRFLQGFLDAPEPCCAVGLIEERKQVLPLLALRVGLALPDEVAAKGFEFGHAVLGDNDYELVQFIFEFRGFGTFHVLLNPRDLAVSDVLRRMVEQERYFILAIDPDHRVTSFRADAGDVLLTGLRDHLPRLLGSKTSGARYNEVLARLRQRPQPPGRVLAWACRGDPTGLDLQKDRLELSPAPSCQHDGAEADSPDSRDDNSSSEPSYQPIEMLPTVAAITAGELDSARELQQHLRLARGRPHVLGDADIERPIRLCENQLEMAPTYREQVARWHQGSPSRSQREALARLSKDVDQLEKVVPETREIAQEMASGTIDAILRMDDAELGMAVFEGRMQPPSGIPPSEELRNREAHGIAVMLDVVGGSLPTHADLLERLAVAAPHMALFKRLMDICGEEEVNALCGAHPGLYRVARTMEEAVAAIQSGAIHLPR
jgi:hypothetical protein